MIIRETKRLILREWQEKDIDDFFFMNQDPKVMEYFPSLADRDKTAWLMGRFCEHHNCHGFSIYPVILKENNQFIGFCGLLSANFNSHFTPAVEIGWRFKSEYWGNGYAPEAANAMLEIGFTQFNLDEIVSFTSKNNLKSRRVMEKIGMSYNIKDEFNHPNLDDDSPLKCHVLYRIKNNQDSLRINLEKLENSLWQEETRFDLKYMNQILHAKFFEFGRSGKVYQREDTLDVKPQKIKAKIPLENFKIHHIKPDVIQVTYISETRLNKELQRASRSSIWINEQGNWQLYFHQGTKR